MNRDIIRQSVMDMGGSASGRDVADRLKIRYELAMRHLNGLEKAGDRQLEHDRAPTLR